MRSILSRPVLLYLVAAAALLGVGVVLLWPTRPPRLPAAAPSSTPTSAGFAAAPTATNPAVGRPASPAAAGDTLPPASPEPLTVTRAPAVPTSRATTAGVDEPMDEAPPDPADAPAGAPQTIAVDPASPTAGAAIERATGFTTAYARPSRTSQHAWWARVTPHLSPQAVLDYNGVLATRVPYTRVTGPGRLQPFGDGSQRVLLVAVPTDAGIIRVHLVQDEARGWVVTRAEMPARR